MTILEMAKERSVDIYNKYLKFEAPLYLNVDGEITIPIRETVIKLEEELKSRPRVSTPIQENRKSKRTSLRER
jgi:hypothetical protein